MSTTKTKEETRIYKIDTVLLRVHQEKYTKDTEQALLDDGYQEIPGSDIGCMKTYFCSTEDKQDVSYRYAVYVVNGDARYLVLIEDTKSYVYFMQQIAPVAHIFGYFVKNAG